MFEVGNFVTNPSYILKGCVIFNMGERKSHSPSIMFLPIHLYPAEKRIYFIKNVRDGWFLRETDDFFPITSGSVYTRSIKPAPFHTTFYTVFNNSPHCKMKTGVLELVLLRLHSKLLFLIFFCLLNNKYTTFYGNLECGLTIPNVKFTNPTSTNLSIL